MRRFLLVVLGLAMVASGTAWAQCSGCENMKIFGYMAPNLRMIDSGNDDVKNNLGFGMAYNRVVWAGSVEGGKIVKNVAWRVETDLKESGSQFLQYAYVEPKFSDLFSLTFGRTKKPFSLEVLYSTANQITTDRHPGTSGLIDLGYANFGYGLMANINHEVVKVNAGVFDGQGAKSNVAAQDPALDYGARVVITPPSVKGLEIGANVMMTTLPFGGKDRGLRYSDGDTDSTEYLSNSGMAFGADINFSKDFGTMNFTAQAEVDMGDNWSELSEEKVAGEVPAYDEETWYKFMYMYLKARLMVTPDLGIYLGFSQWDPNTGSDKIGTGNDEREVGENNETTTIVPGLIYYWTKNLRTMVEVQMVTEKNDWDFAKHDWLEDTEYTHFVLQQVFIWP